MHENDPHDPFPSYCTFQIAVGDLLAFMEITLLETKMETQKGPYKDYSPSKMRLHGFPC